MTELNERAQKILNTIIDCYLKEGSPVGSNTLARQKHMRYSASTIRNVMSELEELGYLRSPHTSAGRVPTSQGYRLFVDALLTLPNRENIGAQQVLSPISQDLSGKLLFDHTSNVMAELTSLCSLVALPKKNKEIIEHIEFVCLSDNRILAVVVLASGEVQNRIVANTGEFSRDLLQFAGKFITEHCCGLDLEMARHNILKLMKEDQRSMEENLRLVVNLADQVMAEVPSEQMIVSGQSHLLESAGEQDINILRSLFKAFSEKHSILQLLDQCLSASRVQIFIGEESGYHLLQDCSVVAAPYSTKNQQIGVLAVVGPTRMDYKRAIQVVDITAKMLTSTLNS